MFVDACTPMDKIGVVVLILDPRQLRSLSPFTTILSK